MKYDLILFDADDTLFDFSKSEEVCFEQAFSGFGFVEDLDKFYDSYRRISSELWGKLERGEISKDFLRIERFRLTLEKHNLIASAESLSEAYLSLLPQKAHLIDGAEELLKILHGKTSLGIVTNGILEVQKARLKNSGLESYFDFMVVSDDCGYAKPDSRFFEYTMTKTNVLDLNRILVVGDRLETDILGANNFGLHSCWFNPHKKSQSNIQPKYEISKLSDLKDLISN